MISGAIRSMALCIIRNGDKILVMDGYDPKKDQTFYRLLGGGIDFGEFGKETLEREFQEELAIGLNNIKFVTVSENIFTFNGEKGHEITLIYEANLTQKDFYQKDSIKILDSKGGHYASWQKISDFKEKKLRSSICRLTLPWAG